MKTQKNSPKICILGLGYVGLPLALEFSKKYKVVGFDINEKRVSELNATADETAQVESDELRDALQNGLTLTSSNALLSDCNIFIVTVPTPIDQNRLPDLGPLLNASGIIGKNLKKGDYVIYESTTYPGCTEEDCIPVLEKESGLIFNQDFYVGYSPERINPGDKINTLTKIKKVTSGSTPEAADFIDELYASIITAGTHKAPSIKVAEASKAIENAQRDINISFVNELTLIFDRMGIETSAVLEAAGTKWNFLKFTPGLVGGHCISVDPYYLAYKSTQLGYVPKVINSGREVNEHMPYFYSNKIISALQKKEVEKGIILILGASFKENTPDIRNSQVPTIALSLINSGFTVDIYDPMIDVDDFEKEYKMKLIEGAPCRNFYDFVLLAVPHTAFLKLNIYDFLKYPSEKEMMIDIKGAYNK
ncbi:MAG: nucleotide sugar dehydrogenase [Bacteroidota bacterium]